MRVYFDNAATTPLSPEVIEEMTSVMSSHYGNPSSIHADGRHVRVLIEKARKSVANLLNASVGEIFFTSGGTESNNTALKCAVRDLGVKRIITSKMEHHCVLHSVESLHLHNQVELVYVDLNKETVIDHDSLRSLLSNSTKTTLVSLMHANNETGCMIDLNEISQICKEHGALFHTDTVQTIGHAEFDLENSDISFLSGSAHKFHGPKGCGFLYINANNNIKPLIEGGSQERNMRAGTENIYGIAGLAKALEMAIEEMDERMGHITQLREHFINEITSKMPEVYVFGGERKPHLETVLNLSFPPHPKGSLLLLNLDMEGISASGGSACSSGSMKGSHVMQAMGQEEGRSNVRFSFSHYNTIEEVNFTVEKLEKILAPVEQVI